TRPAPDIYTPSLHDALPILKRQIARGGMPTLARWLSSGELTLDRWEPLLPTQTSASQAGILHGNNDGIPAFRWWEKATQHLYVRSEEQTSELQSRFDRVCRL